VFSGEVFHLAPGVVDFSGKVSRALPLAVFGIWLVLRVLLDLRQDK